MDYVFHYDSPLGGITDRIRRWNREESPAFDHGRRGHVEYVRSPQGYGIIDGSREEV